MPLKTIEANFKPLPTHFYEYPKIVMNGWPCADRSSVIMDDFGELEQVRSYLLDDDRHGVTPSVIIETDQQPTHQSFIDWIINLGNWKMIPPLADPFWIVIGFCSLTFIIPLVTLGLYILAEKAFSNSSIVSNLLEAITKRLAVISVNGLFIQSMFKTMPYVAILQIFIGTFMYYSFEENLVVANIVWFIPIFIWVSIAYLWSGKQNKNESKADILSSKI